MPSAFAHAFVGASIAQAAPSGSSRLRVIIVLALCAAAPDLDVLAFRLGIPYAHPLGHRGLTHSIPFALLLAPLVAWLAAGDPRADARRFRAVALLAFFALASHGLLDAFTDAGLGVGLFIPFDDGRYFAPWRPLLTSPLSVRAFFDGSGLAILLNEAIWIGAPVAVAWGIGRVAGWRAARAEETR
jgi:inner membrane protein